MMTKEKITKITELIQNLRENTDDRRLLNSASIMEILINHVDDLQEEIIFLKEENESLRFDLQDKKFEEGPRRRTRRERI